MEAANAILTWLEKTSLAMFIHEAKWAFTTIEVVHVVAISLVIGSIAIVDLRLLGLASTKRPFTLYFLPNPNSAEPGRQFQILMRNCTALKVAWELLAVVPAVLAMPVKLKNAQMACLPPPLRTFPRSRPRQQAARARPVHLIRA